MLEQRADIPRVLADELARRYEEHGGEYVSEEKTEDGIPINLCMSKNNLIDVEEELVDAIFNALVYRLRNPYRQNTYDNKDSFFGADLLNALIPCWIMIKTHRALHDSHL